MTGSYYTPYFDDHVFEIGDVVQHKSGVLGRVVRIRGNLIKTKVLSNEEASCLVFEPLANSTPLKKEKGCQMFLSFNSDDLRLIT